VKLQVFGQCYQILELTGPLKVWYVYQDIEVQVVLKGEILKVSTYVIRNHPVKFVMLVSESGSDEHRVKQSNH
jgi:hypothetical protein